MKTWTCILTIVVSIIMLFCNFSYAQQSSQPSMETKGSGGIVVVRVDPGCPVSEVLAISLYAKENTEMHPCRWVYIPGPYEKTETGFTFLWNTLKCHNTPYTLKAVIKRTDSNTPVMVKSQIEITNLVISYCSPDNIISTDSVYATCELTLMITDNDPMDPMDIEVYIYGMDDVEKPVRILRMYGLKGDKHTLVWDKKNDSGTFVDSAPYTFDIIIKQSDELTYQGKTFKAEDSCKYRSRYLTVGSVMDENGVKLIDTPKMVKVVNGVPKNAYQFTAYYTLTDSDAIDAKNGRIWLYGGDSWPYIFDMQKLHCTRHKTADSHKASRKGQSHQVVFYPPDDYISSESCYIAVDFYDNHAADYRDHTAHRALTN